MNRYCSIFVQESLIFTRGIRCGTDEVIFGVCSGNIVIVLEFYYCALFYLLQEVNL